MKVVHFAEFAPHGCGMYHTTKDLIKAEIGQGIDAHFIDMGKEDVPQQQATKDTDSNSKFPIISGYKPEQQSVLKEPGKKDGWLTTSDVSVADDADILVRHTSMPNELGNAGIPVVMAMHGRPEGSILFDEQGDNPVVQAFYTKGQDCRYKAFFTYWKEHMPFWERIVPKHKLHYVPSMVDLMEWRPGGKKYDFGKLNGSPNILIADVWREDITPYQEVMDVIEWIKTECPSARLHIAAAPTSKGVNVFWRALRDENILGYACGQTKAIKELYAACDVIVTPHTLNTRIVREGRAMGKSVISSKELPEWLKAWEKNPGGVNRASRKIAEKEYRLSNAGIAVKKIYDSILNQKPTKRKVLLDIGGHIGETVRRFYREVDDARFYEIHTFEPVGDCFDVLLSNTKRIKNVTAWQRLVIGTNEEHRNMFIDSEKNHDGSTSVVGKLSGGVNYDNPIQVDTINLRDFISDRLIMNGDCYVVLKMNIEGGEYELMQHIIKDNLMPYFNQIYVQTHNHKIEGNTAFYAGLERQFAAEAEKHHVQLFMQKKGMARFQCSQS